MVRALRLLPAHVVLASLLLACAAPATGDDGSATLEPTSTTQIGTDPGTTSATTSATPDPTSTTDPTSITVSSSGEAPTTSGVPDTGTGSPVQPSRPSWSPTSR